MQNITIETMTFPYVQTFLETISTANYLVLFINAIVLGGFEVLLLIKRFRPGWFIRATWIIGVGGFYASLAAMVVFIIADSANH
jgi:hypothetical protein